MKNIFMPKLSFMLLIVFIASCHETASKSYNKAKVRSVDEKIKKSTLPANDTIKSDDLVEDDLSVLTKVPSDPIAAAAPDAAYWTVEHYCNNPSCSDHIHSVRHEIGENFLAHDHELNGVTCEQCDQFMSVRFGFRNCRYKFIGKRSMNNVNIETEEGLAHGALNYSLPHRFARNFYSTIKVATAPPNNAVESGDLGEDDLSVFSKVSSDPLADDAAPDAAYWTMEHYCNNPSCSDHIHSVRHEIGENFLAHDHELNGVTCEQCGQFMSVRFGFRNCRYKFIGKRSMNNVTIETEEDLAHSALNYSLPHRFARNFYSVIKVATAPL